MIFSSILIDLYALFYYDFRFHGSSALQVLVSASLIEGQGNNLGADPAAPDLHFQFGTLLGVLGVKERHSHRLAQIGAVGAGGGLADLLLA